MHKLSHLPSVYLKVKADCADLVREKPPMKTKIKQIVVVCTLAATLFIGTGCETKAGTGALIGGGVGAVAGGLIGNNAGGHNVGGALIGGAVGAVGGGLIGHAMDENDKKKEEARYTSDYDRNFDQYGNRRAGSRY